MRDFEELDGVSSAAAVTAAKAWIGRIGRIEDQLDRKAISYTGNNLAPMTMMHFSASPLRVRNYTTMCPLVPDGWTRWHFWQNSARGSVDGVTGDVDTNFFNGDAAALTTSSRRRTSQRHLSTCPQAAPPDLVMPPTDRPDMAFVNCP